MQKSTMDCDSYNQSNFRDNKGKGRYKFDELFNISDIYRLTKQFSDLVGISSAIIGVDGYIWVKCNWQEICDRFHRKHPEVRKRCLRSDVTLPKKFSKSQDGCVYRCENGLYEAAAPISIQGEHIANLYIGQFLKGPPDIAYFMNQAKRFGFDETEYIQALLNVPVFSEEKVRSLLGFFSRLAALIGELGLNRIELMDSNASLSDSEKRYRLVVENAGEAILIVQNGRVVFANQKVIKNIGLEQDFLHLIHQKERSKVLRFFKKVYKNKSSMTLDSVKLEASSGQNRWVHINATSLTWQSEPALLLHVFDVTAQKKAEQTIKKAQQELANAQKMEAIANLATGIAHDFNNFAQIIGTNTELLLARETPDTPRYQKLREIEIAVTKTSELTQRLLMFREGQSGSRQTVDVNQLLEQVTGSLKALLPPDVEIELELKAICKVKEGDSIQLFQTFMNLILNAKDSMPKLGTILIQTDDFTPSPEHIALHPDLKEEEYIRIRIIDEGCGLSEKDIVHFFEPFYTSKPLGQGHGLGLTAVYNFVKNHSGHIDCENIQGTGACITIYLPAERDAKQVIQLPVGGYETILLVDDDPYIINGGKEYLHSYGYTVLQSMSGEEAYEVYKENQDKVSLVIMDLVMPGMGGEKCIEKLLKIDKNVNILVASAYLTDSFIKNTAIKDKIKGFISKPYVKGRLLHAIRKAVLRDSAFLTCSEAD